MFVFVLGFPMNFFFGCCFVYSVLYGKFGCRQQPNIQFEIYDIEMSVVKIGRNEKEGQCVDSHDSRQF